MPPVEILSLHCVGSRAQNLSYLAGPKVTTLRRVVLDRVSIAATIQHRKSGRKGLIWFTLPYGCSPSKEVNTRLEPGDSS